MKRFAGLMLALAAMATSVFSQEVPDAPAQPDFGVLEVHSSEALRRGNAVVVAGEGPRGAQEEAVIAATAPPPVDSSMWYISIFKQKGCGPCDQLIADFQRSDFLKAYVEAPPKQLAWAHFNVYDVSDETQKDRLKRYAIGGTPTIVVQPPRDGSWGDPAVVVAQMQGYDGDAKAMSEKISAAVKLFASKMQQQGYPRYPIGPHSDIGRIGEKPDPTIGGAAQAPPFTVPQPVNPFQPVPTPTPVIQFPPLVQPQPTPAPTPEPAPRPLQNFNLTNILLLVLVGAKVWQMVAAKTPSLTDDAIAALVVSVLTTLTGGQSVPNQNQIKAAIRDARSSGS